MKFSDFERIPNAGRGNCGALALETPRFELAVEIRNLYNRWDPDVRSLVCGHALDQGITEEHYVSSLFNDGIEFGFEAMFAYLYLTNTAVRVWFADGRPSMLISKAGAPGNSAIHILYSGGVKGHWERLVPKAIDTQPRNEYQIDHATEFLIAQFEAEERQAETDRLKAFEQDFLLNY